MIAPRRHLLLGKSLTHPPSLLHSVDSVDSVAERYELWPYN
jgi:hypothetical protein